MTKPALKQRLLPRGGRGMTLLEVMLAMAVFSFIMVFLSRISSYSSRQKEKLGLNIKASRIESNVLDLMKRDFRGLVSFFDSNFVLRESFPAKDPRRPEGALSPSGRGASWQRKARRLSPFDYLRRGAGRDFDFKGKPEEMEFASITWISSFQGKTGFQLAWLRYALESCRPLEGEGAESKCLIRELWERKDPLNSEKPKERHALFEGIKSLAFSYYDAAGNEWRDEWEDKERARGPDSPPFPRFAKVEIEWEEGRLSPQKTSVYQFPVSQHFSGSANQSLIIAGMFAKYAQKSAERKKKPARPEARQDRKPVEAGQGAPPASREGGRR